MKTTQILIAGFGGQGILFAGKFLAYKGLLEDLQVSWLPSYGPEMRGGTANCNVILSEEAVGSPIVTEPEAIGSDDMNGRSLEFLFAEAMAIELPIHTERRATMMPITSDVASASIDPPMRPKPRSLIPSHAFRENIPSFV